MTYNLSLLRYYFCVFHLCTHKLNYQNIKCKQIISMINCHSYDDTTIPCKQAPVCHVAVESNLYFSYAIVLLHCINAVMTRVVFRPFRLIDSFDCHGFSYVLFVIEIIRLPLSAFCDVCKYMFKMDQSNWHNNQIGRASCRERV